MLMAFWQVQRLTREMNAIEYRLNKKMESLSKYQKYSSMLGATTNMSALNISGLPPELTARATMFAQYVEQVSSMSAYQNLQQYQMMGMMPMNMSNEMMNRQIQMSAFKNFKEEAIRALKQQEIAFLHQKEAEIQLEINQLQTQLTMKKEFKKSCEGLMKESISELVPKFGL